MASDVLAAAACSDITRLGKGYKEEMMLGLCTVNDKMPDGIEVRDPHEVRTHLRRCVIEGKLCKGALYLLAGGIGCPLWG